MSLNFEIVGLDFDFPFMYIKKNKPVYCSTDLFFKTFFRKREILSYLIQNLLFPPDHLIHAVYILLYFLYIFTTLSAVF